MATPTIDIYQSLLAPIGERLRNDERFAEVKTIIYDADEITFGEMPAIEYYVDGTVEDRARGSSAASLQQRWLVLRVTFDVCVYDTVRQQLDEALFHVTGLLLDWLRENTDFNPAAGVGISRSPIVVNVQRQNVQGGGYMGVHTIVVEFDVYSGPGF